MVLRIKLLIINSVTDVTDLKRYTYIVMGWKPGAGRVGFRRLLERAR
jgi:hypothetical protein